MNFARKHLKWTACLATALAVTAATVLIDRGRAERNREQEALRWARQIAAQAEGMVYGGKSRGERDPIAWAVGFLSQGVEPRIVQITKVRAGLASGASEGFAFDDRDKVFDYTRTLAPETGAGVKIRIASEYAGFAGTRDRFSSDLVAFFFFALVFGIGALSITRSPASEEAAGVTKPVPPPAPPRVARDQAFIAAIAEWAAGGKTALNELGLSIRDLLRQASAMSASSAKARVAVDTLRDRLHLELSSIRQARRNDPMTEAAEALAQADALMRRMRAEFERLKLGRPALDGLASEMCGALAQIRSAHDKPKQALRDLEIRMEPWAIDADVASQALHDTAEATLAMNQRIDAAKSSLIDQARRLKSIGALVSASQASPQAAPVVVEPRLPDPLPEPSVPTFGQVPAFLTEGYAASVDPTAQPSIEPSDSDVSASA